MCTFKQDSEKIRRCFARNTPRFCAKNVIKEKIRVHHNRHNRIIRILHKMKAVSMEIRSSFKSASYHWKKLGKWSWPTRIERAYAIDAGDMS